jgi:hypothetical protein
MENEKIVEALNAVAKDTKAKLEYLLYDLSDTFAWTGGYAMPPSQALGQCGNSRGKLRELEVEFGAELAMYKGVDPVAILGELKTYHSWRLAQVEELLDEWLHKAWPPKEWATIPE